MATFKSIAHGSAAKIQKIEVLANPETSSNANGVFHDETKFEALLETLAKKEFQVNIEPAQISLPAPIVNIDVPRAEVRVEPACPHVEVPPPQVKIIKQDDPKLLYIALIPSLLTLCDIALRIFAK